MDIQDLFNLGMKRLVPDLIEPDHTLALNLGCGNSHIPGTIGLDYPAWNAATMPIPYDDGSVSAIYAFHFLEHLTGEQAIELLREVQRVLKPGGVMTLCVPLAGSIISFQDLDHKSFYTEETWKTLFANPYYGKHREEPWMLKVHANFMMGVVQRNMALFSQLVRV